jgi:hypothetical protein
VAKYLAVRVKINNTKLKRKLSRKQALINQIPKDAYNYFVRLTPVGNPRLWKSDPPRNYRPGNARRRTYLRNNVIHADYAYARRLDREAWSKQAIEGMTRPTIEFIKKIYKILMRKP